MKLMKAWIVGAAAAGAALLCWRAAAGDPPKEAAALTYATRCEISAPASVDGTVTNQSQDVYQVNGMVTFNFTDPGGSSRAGVSARGSGVIYPGRTEIVAHASVPFVLGADKQCEFLVAGAIGKLQK